MRTFRRSVAVATVVAAVLLDGVAFAGSDEREVCAASAEHGQQLRDEGKYRRAREQMLVCAREVCPAPIKSDCGKWLTELDRDAPTVVFGARDSKGADILDAKVSMDGAPLLARLDGKPILVDSGEHTFKFETKDGAVKEERVLIAAGSKARSIIATFGGPVAEKPKEGPATATTTSSSSAGLLPPILVGSIGVVALTSFAIFGIGGKNDVDDLQRCKPDCKQADVDSARTKLIIADSSLGVGVVALGVAAYMFFKRPSADAKGPARTGVYGTKRAASHGLELDARPIAGGAFAGIGTRF